MVTGGEVILKPEPRFPESIEVVAKADVGRERIQVKVSNSSAFEGELTFILPTVEFFWIALEACANGDKVSALARKSCESGRRRNRRRGRIWNFLVEEEDIKVGGLK